MDGNIEAGTGLAMRDYLVKSGIHIPVLWIPAIPAGMTCFLILVYNDECSAWG
jgi:ABC-type arginine transport system permease subunit